MRIKPIQQWRRWWRRYSTWLALAMQFRQNSVSGDKNE